MRHDQKITGSQKSMAERLAAALEREEFVLYSQTIVRVQPEKPADPFQEVFIRFKEEDSKLLPPGDFFSILADHDLLPLLDRWVVHRLLHWASAALRIKPDWVIPISNINLSEATIADHTFGEYVNRYVDRSPLSGGVLGFEVDCESAIRLEVPLQNLLKEISPAGCLLTLADFDGSDNAFWAVKKFAPEYVKISAIGIDSTRISEIGRRCRSLGTQTIAQYVESAESLDRLRDLNIDFAQGLHLSAVEPL